MTFLVFFLTVWSLYWALGKKEPQNFLLALSSYVFYGWWDYRFCSLMLVSSLLDYAVGLALARVDAPRLRKGLLLLSICGNLGLLGFFKYYDFFAESLAALGRSLGVEISPATLHVLLPVGISFYSFQTLGYAIDVYRRDLAPTRNLIDFLAFVSFFPQLVAGPIERAGNLLPQITSPRRFDAELAADGCRQMLWGVLKKIVIADNLAVLVDRVYASPATQSGPQLALGTVCFAFQIYCDFSAYSDIAMGCSNLFGIRLMRNFAYPYFSRSLTEFWQRWHISLSTWFRDYVYIPLGGNQRGMARWRFNLVATFLLSGLWHGAAWQYVLWGGLNGAGVVSETWLRRRGSRPVDEVPGGAGGLGLRSLAGIVATFTFICLGWVLFRAPSLADAWLIFRRMATESASLGAWQSLWETMVGGKVALIGLLIFIGLEWSRRTHLHPLVFLGPSRSLRWALYTLAVLVVCQLAAATGREFIYFQF